MQRPLSFALAFMLGLMLIPVVARGEPMAAVVETTLETGSRQIRQFAYDGDAATYFASKGNPTASDHFTLIFDQPVSVKSVAVVTGKGDPEATDALEIGVLEVSSDGKTFTELAKFASGEARGDAEGKPIQAVRIKPTAGQSHPLAVREFTVVSEPPVAIFKYPVEFEVDCSDSPEMTGWAEEVARLCERWYPRLNEMLKSDGYKPTHYVKMRITPTYNGVAAAGGGNIVGSSRFFKAHPDDAGAMIHETTHIIQRYRGRNNPSWLVEGLADYIRFFQFEPGKIGPINARRARYDASYRTTAAFLAYVVDTYDKSLISELNTLMREGKYKEEVFKDLTGKTVKELDEEWRASLTR